MIADTATTTRNNKSVGRIDNSNIPVAYKPLYHPFLSTTLHYFTLDYIRLLLENEV